MVFFYILLICVILFSILAIIYVSYFNSLQYTKTKIEQAESIIDETLRVRYDLVMRTSDIVKTNLKEKKDYFKEYALLKEKKVSNFEMDRELKEAMNIIMNLRNDYQELHNNTGIKEIVGEIKDSDEKLSAAKAYYDRYTNELNELIRKFPSNFIAKIHHFSEKTFFDGKNMNDDDLLDFKL